MKTLHIFRSILACLMIGLALFSSCKKHDPDPEVDREKFLGSYELVETCGDESLEVGLFIAPGIDNNAIEIEDLYLPLTTIKATISGNTLTIPSQEVIDPFEEDGSTFTIIGDGVLTDNKLTIHYKVTFDDSSIDECTATGNKQ
ncbi:hypothetical protein QNI19_10685 [Cytophagaceae bacterium DM2B3-1]|uniref:Lipocalin-like domain-containing protein n=1 Tax=Xanthocytophaga flava TaxID=3048013 RepID=A0AAE3QKG2_9BACT|nr:hypothetical protein [Xanthocytophaga flavus]MDJ1480570.1 hypothetical protein [Xanthocytophaga flavus]MDJ1493397.1 hypothetical protein [Xanthocytophaga flavus]